MTQARQIPGMPAIIMAAGDPARWVTTHRDDLDMLLLRHGAVRVTGLAVRSVADLVTVREALGRKPASCSEQFAPRRHCGDGVYAWPDWPADRDMCLHHEQSQCAEFPALILMACLIPPDSGALLLGDARAVLDHLPARLVARFRNEGWRLVRNFQPYLGLGWQATFCTDDATELQRYCASHEIDCEWRHGRTLHTIQRRSAVIRHPMTGEECWFNDLAFFSVWSVAEPERVIMLSAFGADGIPFNTGSGTGSELSQADYQAILHAYDKIMRRVTWRPGDLLLIDNVLTAHGREPYTGDWDIAVAPADPVARARCTDPGPTAMPAP